MTLFGYEVPLWSVWIVIAIVVIVLLACIAKGFFDEVNKR